MIGPIPMPSKELPPLLPSVDSLLFLLLLFPPSPPSFPLLSPRIQQHSLWSKLSPPMHSCFPHIPPVARKTYISSDTVSRTDQLPNAPPDTQKSLRNKIKKTSKIEQKRWISSNLHLDYVGSPPDHWKPIKRIRSKYQPRTQSDNKPDGTPCLKSEKSHVPAKHLRDHVWNSKPSPGPIEDPLAPPQPGLDTPFAMFELYRACTKTGRAPGPDNPPMETLRRLPHPVKRYLLSHYN